MRKTLIGTLALSTLTALSLAACALPPAPPPKRSSADSTGTSGISAVGLIGSSWLLASLDGQPPIENTTVTVNFSADRVSGSDGCNRFNGAYTLDGMNLTFGPLAGTLMACPEPIMQQADSFQKALANAKSFKVGEGQLTLLDADNKELATFAVQDMSLAGTSWTVTGYNDGKQAVVSVITGSELNAKFSEDGRVSGSAGCNNFTGSYTVEGDNSVKIGPLASTRKWCPTPEGLMEQERQFLAALASAATYRVDGNRMEMRTARDALAATFTRAK